MAHVDRVERVLRPGLCSSSCDDCVTAGGSALEGSAQGQHRIWNPRPYRSHWPAPCAPSQPEPAHESCTHPSAFRGVQAVSVCTSLAPVARARATPRARGALDARFLRVFARPLPTLSIDAQRCPHASRPPLGAWHDRACVRLVTLMVTRADIAVTRLCGVKARGSSHSLTMCTIARCALSHWPLSGRSRAPRDARESARTPTRARRVPAAARARAHTPRSHR